MAELVRRTGVPRATIHYYRRLGLLPAAERGATNRFLYDQRHVDALFVIRFLRERRGMSLEEIGHALPSLLDQDQEEAFGWDGWSAFLEDEVPIDISDTPRNRILEQATAAFTARGSAQVSLDEITAAAGVAKGSLYRYYESKEALFLAVLDRTADEIAEAFGHEVADARVLDESNAAHILGSILDSRLPLFADLFARAVRQPKPFAGHGVAIWLRLIGRLSSHIEQHTDISAQRAPQILVQGFGAALGRIAGQLGVDPFAAGRATGRP